MLIKKRIQTGEETNTAEKLESITLETAKIHLVLLYQYILDEPARPFNLFQDKLFSTTTSGGKGLALVYKIQFTGKINVS